MEVYSSTELFSKKNFLYAQNQSDFVQRHWNDHSFSIGISTVYERTKLGVCAISNSP